MVLPAKWCFDVRIRTIGEWRVDQLLVVALDISEKRFVQATVGGCFVVSAVGSFVSTAPVRPMSNERLSVVQRTLPSSVTARTLRRQRRGKRVRWGVCADHRHSAEPHGLLQPPADAVVVIPFGSCLRRQPSAERSCGSCSPRRIQGVTTRGSQPISLRNDDR